MKHFLLAIASILASASSVAAERLEYPVFGFSIDAPEGWVLASDEDVRKNIDKLNFKSEEFKGLVQKFSRVPFINLMQFPEPHPDLNSSIRINTRLGQIEDPVGVMKVMNSVLSEQFENYEVKTSPQKVSVAGRESAVLSFTYLLRTADRAAEFLARSTIYIVPNGNHFYIVGLGASNPIPPDIQSTFEKAIESIKIH